MLTFNNVKKRYGSHLILDIPKLEIADGLYWLKGANGSGKSTLLKMATGIIPFEGEIDIEKINLKKQPVAFRNLVSYAEAEPLYPAFVSGVDLISFYNSVRKSDKSNSDELIDRFSIGGFYKNPIGTYSSGMIKKLSLALAFIGNPKFIFLDEPLVTLDQNSLPVLYSLICEHSKIGVNFIFTSHQPFESEHLPPTTEILIKDNIVWTQ